MIRVTGKAEIEIKPDTAIITIRAEAVDDWTGDAVTRTASLVNKVLDKLRNEHSVLLKDIKTTTLILSTDKEYSNGRTIVHGQKAEESIILTLHDIEKIGPIFSSLAAIDGIEISSPILTSSEMDANLDKARKLAIENAIHKAKTYAEAASIRLGRILSIKEIPFSEPIAIRSSIDYLPQDLKATAAIEAEFETES